MYTLHLQWAIRTGGGNRTKREYFDFCVSGRSLKTILGIPDADFATLIGYGTTRDFDKRVLNVFRLKEKSWLETGRVMLYVCPECGDIGCGAITAVVLDRGARIVWQDFGFENGYGDITQRYSDIGPIEFDRQSYFEAFSGNGRVYLTSLWS